MPFEYDEPVIAKRRTGLQDDPFTEKDEDHIIDNSGKIILSEIPNEFARVAITMDNGAGMSEIQIGTPDIDEFKVDYVGRYVTFHKDNIGKQVNVVFRGEGLIYVPADMVYTERDGLTIVETLRDLIDTLNENEAERIENENERIANEDERIENENERIASENVRKQNEEDRQQAESERDDAENIRKSNEDQRISQENTRKSNETARINAENTRKSNENQRIADENIRKSNESDRRDAESDREDAEDVRRSNEDERISQENTRKAQESDRVQAEDIRIDNENTRESNEDTREQNESTRESNEATRQSRESARQSSESQRVANEDTRKSQESIRQSNEATRQNRESDRQSAESTRESNEQSRIQKDQKRQEDTDEAIGIIEDTLSDMNRIVDDTRFIEEYSSTTNYKVNNIVYYNGSSFIALRDTVGNAPPNPVNAIENNWWGLLAARGQSGSDALEDHLGDTNNPHRVTSEDVNLLVDDFDVGEQKQPIDYPNGISVWRDSSNSSMYITVSKYTVAIQYKTGNIRMANKNIEVRIGNVGGWFGWQQIAKTEDIDNSHKYGNRYQWQYNEITDSLDLVMLP